MCFQEYINHVSKVITMMFIQKIYFINILYSMLVSRVLYLANLTNSQKIAKLNPRESY